MAKKKKEVINLLPQEEFAASIIGRILKWLLSTFRMIVIATEMVVMAAFLSRFWLDARNTDLTDEIKQKQAIIASYSTFEAQFRSAQTKLNLFASLTDDKLLAAPVMENVVSALPSGIVLKSLTFEKDEIQVRGDTQSEVSAAQFIVNLEAKEKIKDVSLTQIDSSKDGLGVTFGIKAKWQ